MPTSSTGCYGSKSADKWRDLFTHDAVVAQQGVRTVPKGAAHIRFVDGTDLRIGGSSELVLDEFVYDAAGGAGAFTTNMTKGILRMVTGKLAKQGIQIRTPSALIGVRGTDFIVAVLASGATIVSVLVGLVEVTPAAGGDSSEVGVGSTATVAVGATTVTITTAPPPADDGIEDDAELQRELGWDGGDVDHQN